MDVSNEQETAPLIDKYGIPPATRDTRKSYQKQLAIYLILFSTLFERIAFFSLTTNISLTLKPNNEASNWNPQHSPTALLHIFSGTSYISTIIFAIISDAKWGRARTILIGFVLYLIGYTLITIIASGTMPFCPFNATDVDTIPMDTYHCAPAILTTLICIAIGAGAIKSNLAVFGAEQIQESKITARYFDKYVVAVNIGTMIATLIIPYILYELNRFFISYLVAISMAFMAAFLFLIGWRYYIHVKPYETVVANLIPVIINAFQSKSIYKKNKRSIDDDNTNSISTNFLNASSSNLSEEEKSIRIDHRPSTFLDFAKVPNGKFHDRIVDDVKSLRGALIVFSLLIPYWLLYNQTSTTFQSQGKHMKRPPNAEYIVSWMSLGDPVTIIIGILILNMFVYKYLDARHRSLTITTKFIIGMCFAVLCMCIAGTVETVRQQDCIENNGNNQTDFPIYTQLPQNVAIGFSQLFAMLASYEYAFTAAPLSAQSLFMSLHFCSAGISSFIGVAYMAIISGTSFELDFSCPSQNDNKWISYTYFFILAGLQLIFIVIFIICHKKYRIIKLNPQQM